MSTDLIARTGRVQSWIDDPTSRLPVSCTVFVVEDTMEGPNGIEASWRFVSHALRYGAGVAVHLSKLRPRGEENDKGLVASGPVSFAKIYSTLNEILRRGGVYKNGAVTGQTGSVTITGNAGAANNTGFVKLLDSPVSFVSGDRLTIYMNFDAAGIQADDAALLLRVVTTN